MKTWVYLLIFSVCSLISLHAYAQRLPTLGIVAPLEKDSLLYAAGFRLLGESVGKTISPALSEEAFEGKLKTIKQSKCKLYLCNVLFPSGIKITGPQVDEKRILTYVDSVFYRAKKADIPLIVLGSGGSRRLPEGYDAAQAKKEFTQLCRKMADVARKHGITIAIESLNSTETNFLNTLQEAAEIVKNVNHPSFRLNADIYHMMKENEPPQHIIDAAKLIVYAEIAEKEKRSFPGVAGEDFRPYLQALKTIGYKGPLVIEGKSENLDAEAPLAYEYLSKQLREVYKAK